MSVRLAIASLTVLPSMLLSAQVDRITIRMVPAPNQTIHVRTSINTTMTMTPDPAAGRSLPIPPMHTMMTMVSEHTTAVGPTDAQGHYQATVVCDTASYSATLNGQPIPASGRGAPPADLVGAVVTFSYDDQGKVVGVETGAGMPANVAGPLKQMLTSVLGAAPPMTLSVGESTTVPTRLDLPLPTGPNAVTMTVSGETTYTLTSVTFDGADRIAHLKTVMTSVVQQGSPVAGAGPRMAFEMRATSEGVSDVNIDRGIVLHSAQQMTLDASMRVDLNNVAPMPAMLTHGTSTISADLTK